MHCISDTFIISNVLLFLVFLVGLYLQIKVIIVSKQEKETTWKINISHSIVVTAHFAIRIFLESMTCIIPSLNQYTGKWFCHVLYFVDYYGAISISSHSLATAAHKYVFIVHQMRIINFGEERAREISFWINLIFPAVLALSFSTMPVIAPVGYLFNCLGMEVDKSSEPNEMNGDLFAKLKLIFFCGVDIFESNYSIFDKVVNVFIITGCFLTSSLRVVIMCNILEGMLYKRIFAYMKR